MLDLSIFVELIHSYVATQQNVLTKSPVILCIA